jgi:hypothetical protein
MEFPGTGVVGMPISDVRASGNNLSFSIPAIRGAWTGFLSADGKTLSGMYNQGKTVPLDLQRVASGDSGKAEKQSSTSVASPPPSSASPEASCPAGSLGNYWDGASWKPLTIAEGSGKKRGYSLKKSLTNPLNPMAGKSIIFVFDGAAASITVGENPRFCFPTTVNTKPEYFVGILSVKNNEREIEKFITDSRSKGGNPIFPADKTLGTNAKVLSDRFVEVTPTEPLKQGQYIITASGGLMFDFGVQ